MHLTKVHEKVMFLLTCLRMDSINISLSSRNCKRTKKMCWAKCEFSSVFCFCFVVCKCFQLRTECMQNIVFTVRMLFQLQQKWWNCIEHERNKIRHSYKSVQKLQMWGFQAIDWSYCTSAFEKTFCCRIGDFSMAVCLNNVKLAQITSMISCRCISLLMSKSSDARKLLNGRHDLRKFIKTWLIMSPNCNSGCSRQLLEKNWTMHTFCRNKCRLCFVLHNFIFLSQVFLIDATQKIHTHKITIWMFLYKKQIKMIMTKYQKKIETVLDYDFKSKPYN